MKTLLKGMIILNLNNCYKFFQSKIKYKNLNFYKIRKKKLWHDLKGINAEINAEISI